MSEEITPEIALRLRFLQLERLNESNETCCDRCFEVVPKASVLEVFRGHTNLFVFCENCMRKHDLLIENTPAHLQISTTDKEFPPVIRSASSTLPSKARLNGFGSG